MWNLNETKRGIIVVIILVFEVLEDLWADLGIDWRIFWHVLIIISFLGLFEFGK